MNILPGGLGYKGGVDPKAGPAPKIEKLGVGTDQSAAAGGAAGTAAVGGVDVQKVATEAAQNLTAAADKFRMLAGVNPFSQHAGMMMDVLAKGHDAITTALDEWGESIRKNAELDQEAAKADDIKRQQLRPPV
jgi:hypothetical protein